MKFFALIPLIWILSVVIAIAVRIRRLRAQGITLNQGLEKAVLAARLASQQPRPQPRPSTALRVIFRLIGGTCMLAGAASFYSTFHFVQTAAHANGQIVDFVAHRGSKGGTTYSPRVRFQAPSGAILLIDGKVSSQLAYFPTMGSSVTVLFDPSNPRRARIGLFMELWFMPIFLFIFGGIFLAVSLISTKSLQQNSSQSPTLPRSPGTKSPDYHIPDIIH
jgi:hypothetical protein